ncbi:MAG: hypothetical protein AB7V42_11245 [Thermoleophilia bacterium]
MTTPLTETRPRPLLDWMQAHPDRLRELLGEEASGAEDIAPVSDAAIRAHLRFVTEALAAGAGDADRERLESLAGSLDAFAATGRLGDAIELVGGATAHELRLQFGESAATDTALGDMTDRRVRLAAWHRVYLEGLEGALGRFDADGATVWMAANQDLLADVIFAMDRHAKQREIDRGGPDAVASTQVANRIGQAATLHAYTRFLVDAIERHLTNAV